MNGDCSDDILLISRTYFSLSILERGSLFFEPLEEDKNIDDDAYDEKHQNDYDETEWETWSNADETCDQEPVARPDRTRGKSLLAWPDYNELCALCNKHRGLKHTFSNCYVSLMQGRYTWRHDKVLYILIEALENKIHEFNSQSLSGATGDTEPSTIFKSANDWQCDADRFKKKLKFPIEIAKTNLRPDILIWSRSTKTVFLIELTVPWDDNIAKAYKRKMLRYKGLLRACKSNGWNATTYPVEVGCRGTSGESCYKLLSDIGILNNEQESLIQKMKETAEKCSKWIFIQRKEKHWGKKRQTLY